MSCARTAPLLGHAIAGINDALGGIDDARREAAVIPGFLEDLVVIEKDLRNALEYLQKVNKIIGIIDGSGVGGSGVGK